MRSPASPPDDERFFELAAFLVSSARGALEEGVYTASLRLLDAAGRLAALADDLGRGSFLRGLGEAIRRDAAARYFESAEAYTAFLDEILVEVAREIRRRNNLPESAVPPS